MRIAPTRHSCRLQHPIADNACRQAGNNVGLPGWRDKLETRLYRRSEIYWCINLIERSFG
jgi:hypothetical protein